MAADKKHVYDESKIKTLSSLEHIRLRTGMYIGRIGDGSHYDDGCYILLKEVIDNAIDEFIMGYGKEVQIGIEDAVGHGAGFRARAFRWAKWWIACRRSTPGRNTTTTSSNSASGLNGVGTKAVNALSKEFLVRSYPRRANSSRRRSSRANSRTRRRGKAAKEPDGTLIRFEPDPEIFKKVEFRPEHVERRLRHYSYLNTGLKLVFNGQTFQSAQRPVGSGDGRPAGRRQRADLSAAALREKTLEFCFTHSNSRYGETFYSFVNGQYTADGGTHLSAFREGLLKAVNEYAQEKFDGDDVRESMVGAVAIRLKDPVFESQTKNKLGNTEIRTDLVNRVREELLQFFNRNKEIAEKIVAKVQDTRQLRKELQEVKKLARERAKAITIRIPQLKDCKDHL